MAEPVAPVETTAITEACQPDSRVAAETLSLSLDLLAQERGSLTVAKQMRKLAELSDSLVGER